MNYKFAAHQPDPNRIVLVRSRTMQIVLSLFLFLAAIAVLPAGLLLLLGDPDPYRPFFLTGMGLLFLSGGIAINTMLNLPNSLVFDNVTGALLVFEGRGKKARQAALPYPDIETFQVNRHRRNRSTSYIVEILKKDGSFWTLFQSGSEKKAGEFRDRLLERVTLRGTSAADKQAPPACVTVAERGDSTAIEWRNRYTAGRYLMTVMLIGSMAMLIYGSRPYATSGAGYYIALAFISFIILITIWSMIDSIGRSNIVEIDRTALSYRRPGGITRTGQFTLPLGDIDAVIYNFSVSSGETGIYVLTAAEKEAIQNINRGAVELAGILNAIRVIKDAGRLDVGSLSTGDRLALESLIQETVKRKTGASHRSL
ncbi:MAG TPA: hypothetical protein PK307_14820 [Spirochaetota bacterium]|nr:hypothetical protein [Spirochaetota bacterium]HOD14827.1 hypothetical protein [Spirochaetota bacterium]HPG52343.1 hypothetical protein [Spirochaetota bacterium]HQL83473.1 hypothetical protein [Spirochaetota bacterium]